MGTCDAMDLSGHLHAPGHLRSGMEHLREHLGAGVLSGIRLQGWLHLLSCIMYEIKFSATFISLDV